MVSGGSGSGGSGGGAVNRRKTAYDSATAPPLKREPRRGLGVAELERIRVELEMAERCYISPSLSSPAALFLPLPLPLPGVADGVALPHHHQYVGNGALQIEYLTPYYRAQHYANDPLTRFVTSNGHVFPHQKNQQTQSAATALPFLGQAASSDMQTSSSACHLQDRRRAHPPQLGQTTRPQVAFVDFVDSDDENGGDKVEEELDLELKL